ncbi:hypothetical protein [Chryseobacterium luquanense]|uniref:Uncharacterized protein n=1 Tax=Chryseobacterium luquanense TaxID=2983766 RepID=A0ABT3Y4T7_9FLAO|nr:hypothetical protein [Chryseobacterium luquanense]MCX8533172.1 hypothetical protein [Chryseobacterium luquanense]
MKILLLFSLLSSVIIYSQRRNYFPDSDKTPNCNLIKKGNFTRNEKGNNSFKVKVRKNRMTEIFGKNDIIVESKLKMPNKCKFETEIIKIKTKLKDDFIYIGKKTKYEIVETGKNSIIYEYWCNEGRNICTEILQKE